MHQFPHQPPDGIIADRELIEVDYRSHTDVDVLQPGIAPRCLERDGAQLLGNYVRFCGHCAMHGTYPLQPEPKAQDSPISVCQFRSHAGSGSIQQRIEIR